MTESSAPIAATPAPVGQRRLLTLLFVDLSGSTAMAEWMEAEHYAAMLAGLRALYERIVPHHGGVIARIQGDGMLAVFGHPEVREDDGRRATEAALELHAAVRELQPPGPRPADFPGLALHSGIHAGIVLVNEGDQMRGRFELLGNAPNIAARLSEAAKRDEIIASEESLGLQSQFFDTGPRFSLQLRGRATPLAAYRVFGRAPVGRRYEASMRRGLAPFVGRGHELATLDAALARTLYGRTLWLGIRAGAGVGKTRLTEEFLRHAADQAERPVQVHRGYCESYLSAEPLQPFLQMLRALDGLHDAPPELFAAQHSQAGQRADALLTLLLALARRTPQLVFIDDLQWADDASLRLLHRLRAGAEREGLPLLLLTASRPLPTSAALQSLPGANDSDADLIELPPLTETEAARAVQQLLPQIDPFIAAEVQRHAGGNPLFIEELCHAAADTGEGLVAGQSSSAWLAALVESRVGRLPPEQAQLVRVAAVIGNVIPVWLLQALAGCGEQHPAVQALAAQDFIFPDQRPGHLRFKHGITRDVVYEATGLHERQALHRRISAELAAHGGNELHEQLAYHDAAANDWPAAAHHAEAAGDQALAASALDRAKKQFRAALAALEFLPDGDDQGRERRRRWVAIAQRLGMACVFDASQDDLRVLKHAADLAKASGDTGLIARTEYWLSYVGYALGETRDSLRHARAAVEMAQDCGDNALLAQLPGTVGQLQAAAADYVNALPMLDLAIARQRARARKSAVNQIGLSFSLCCRAYVLGDQGHFDQAHEIFAEALAPFDGSGHAVEASIQGWRAAVLLWQGRWAEAREAALVAHRVGAQVRSMFTCAMGHAAGAYGAWMQEADPTARQHILDATAWLAPRGGGLYSSFQHGWLADILATQGDAGAARHHVAKALRRGRQHDWIGGAMAYRAAARLAARMGDIGRAKRYLGLARGAGEQRNSLHEAAVTALLEAELRLDDHWQAARDRAGREFERLGMTGFLERALQL
ncbi:class 3 adenylate cyclase [Pelomonas saccharophila]|uniref:Class 3 adenylate cyclase n=1 Tax=Roseateles saccharophilus TaxID=304 RepID=A0ABU1YP10_ROSSA|nr:AAA family ATPase [Roseateles saccharophilus]MDR7270594.1 class 3 adenylate cyclase [Roseateles saccharophilus]